MVKVIHRLLLVLLLCPFLAYGQIDEEDFSYNREFIWGINKNTNSGLIGGFIMKFSKTAGEGIYRTIGFEMLNVKHPKERRYISPSTGTSFIYGKQNFLYSIRAQWGYEKIMFQKAPQQGVQINIGAALGPTLGIVAPYYVVSGGESEIYDPNVHISPSAIDGSGKLFEGLGESNVVPGLNAKVGVLFEFGTFRKNVAGIEIGVAAEVFTKKIIIVPTQDNRSFYPSAYFNLFWGTRK